MNQASNKFGETDDRKYHIAHLNMEACIHLGQSKASLFKLSDEQAQHYSHWLCQAALEKSDGTKASTFRAEYE